MPFYLFHWTSAIVAYLAEHDVTPEDFENAVCHPVDVPDRDDRSRSSGRPCCYGFAMDGRLLFCVYELDEDGVFLEPVTAYEVEA
jgi:hypothetical protein